MTSYELSITKTIPASREVVFDAWLSPDILAKFMTPAPGMTICKSETDAQVGGSYRIVMKAGEEELPHHGVYKRIQKFSEICFTWNNPFNDTESIVTLLFEEGAPGQTELTLRHEGLPSEESRDNHSGGWNSILTALSNLLP